MLTKIKHLTQPLAEEIRRDNCGFDHTPADDFVKSQWQQRSKSIPYLVYRITVALFFSAAVIDIFIQEKPGAYFFIYLTYWGIMLCCVTTMFGAVLVAIYHFHPEYEDKLLNMSNLTNPFKIYWALHTTSLVASIEITIIYWAVLYDSKSEILASSVINHICNSVVMIFDLLVVAYPIRLLHAFLPLIFGILYAVFTMIYYYAGGLNLKGETFIYNILDWREPGKTLPTVVGCLALSCVIYVCLFMIYKIRSLVCYRLNQYLKNREDSKEVKKSKALKLSPGISMVHGDYNKGYES